MLYNNLYQYFKKIIKKTTLQKLSLGILGGSFEDFTCNIVSHICNHVTCILGEIAPYNPNKNNKIF
jgi:DNA-binding Xre family transcriptional regulator